jgi:DNA-binding GntR family transcriptional regulator
MADWSGRPAYAQVADALRAEIRAGRFPPGSQLPSYEALMKKYEVSITVVRSAVRELKSEGLVYTHQGKGAFVRDPPPEPGQGPDEQRSEAFHALMAEIKSLHEDLDRFDERLSRLERLVAPGED